MRHAKPELPHNGKLYYGQTDYPLAKEGVESAAAFASELKDIKIDHVFSSNLTRAYHTAKIITGDTIDIEKIDELSEINLGEWEGRSFDEVRATWNDLYEKRGSSFSLVAPPGGESFVDLQKRAVSAFDKILTRCQSGNILVVAHGGVIWTLMSHYFDFKLDNIFFYPMDYCGLHVLTRSNGIMRLTRYNWALSPF